MKKRFYILPAVLLAAVLLAGCQCDHEWLAATCTTAKTCRLCEETEGTPLGHTSGKTETAPDFVSGCMLTTESCAVCKDTMDTESTELDSFIQYRMFLFSPNQFLERLSHIAKKEFPDFHYDLSNSFIGTNAVTAELFFDKTSPVRYLLLFELPNASFADMTDMDTSGVWYLQLIVLYGGKADDAALITDLITSDIIPIFCSSCDPTDSDSDADALQTQVLLALADKEGSNRTYGFSSTCEITYEFQYMTLDGEIVIQLLAHPYDPRDAFQSQDPSDSRSSDNSRDDAHSQKDSQEVSGTYGIQLARSGTSKSFPYSVYDTLPRGRTGTEKSFTYPYELNSPLRQCNGFTLEYTIAEVVKGQLAGNFRYEVLVRNLDGKWKSAGTFQMDGYSAVLDVELPEPMSVTAVAVTCGCSVEVAYSFAISLSNPY